MSRRYPTKSIIARRVRSIVKPALQRTKPVSQVQITTSDYRFTRYQCRTRFVLKCNIYYFGEEAPDTVRVWVTKGEHDAFADGGHEWVVAQIATSVIRNAVPLIVDKAIARMRATRGRSPHTRPASSSRRGAA